MCVWELYRVPTLCKKRLVVSANQGSNTVKGELVLKVTRPGVVETGRVLYKKSAKASEINNKKQNKQKLNNLYMGKI
jgi:hypothetical protein